FDEWRVGPGQGEYDDPEMIGPQGRTRGPGHATDPNPEMSLDWRRRQDTAQPCCLMVPHKAPRRPLMPRPPPRALHQTSTHTDPGARWKYQRYMRDYLQTVQAIDDGVGDLLDYLDQTGQAENTVVIYTSDQGFFLGDHGWFDKRLMFDQSLQMPMLIRWPAEIPAGTRCESMITNVDFAATFLDMCGL